MTSCDIFDEIVTRSFVSSELTKSPPPLPLHSSCMEEAAEKVKQVLHDLEICFEQKEDRMKFKAALYLPHMYARFSIKIWDFERDVCKVQFSRSRGDRFAVHVVHKCLEDVLVKHMDTSFKGQREALFHQPAGFPDNNRGLNTATEKEIFQTVQALLRFVSSPYDDVAINGCLAVARIVNQNQATLASRTLIDALFKVVCGKLSVDTRTLAALALANSCSNGSATTSILLEILPDCLTSLLQVLRSIDCLNYEWHFLKRYWYASIKLKNHDLHPCFMPYFHLP